MSELKKKVSRKLLVVLIGVALFVAWLPSHVVVTLDPLVSVSVRTSIQQKFTPLFVWSK